MWCPGSSRGPTQKDPGCQRKGDVMANFTCGPDRAKGCPDSWEASFLSVSVRESLGEIGGHISRLSKDLPPHCGWASCDPFRA